MSYRINILGMWLQINSELPQEVINAIVQDVELRTRELYDLTRETNRAALFLLVALNLAVELYETRKGYEDISQRAAYLLSEVRHVLQDSPRTPILINHGNKVSSQHED